MPDIRTSELAVAGVRSPVIEAGASDRPEAVVFLHGNPGSRLDWESLVGQVGEFARAVAFDLPGYGQADKPRSFAYTVEGYGEFVAGALAQLGIERAHMVVHDFGGPWCWAWAAHDPERLRSAVLFNTGILTGRTWHSAARRWRTPVLGELSMLFVPYRPFAQALTSGGTLPLPEEMLRRMHRDFDRGTRRAVLRLYRATDLPYASAAGWVRTLSAADRPALIVWGEKDRFAPVAAIDLLHGAFPSAEVVPLADSGHFPFADDPQRCADAVIPFLRKVTAGLSPAADPT